MTYRTLSTQKPTYLVNLLHFSAISRMLRSSVSKQLFVPKTKLNIGKYAFSVAAQTTWIFTDLMDFNLMDFSRQYSHKNIILNKYKPRSGYSPLNIFLTSPHGNKHHNSMIDISHNQFVGTLQSGCHQNGKLR